MGVHTLGKADIFNSGFHGTWVNNEQVENYLQTIHTHTEIFLIFQGYFNNQYYTNMVNTSLDWALTRKVHTTKQKKNIRD